MEVKFADSNCPFRLFKNDKFRSVFEKIPTDTFAPNVIHLVWHHI